jgi:hypothetical protein
MNDNIENSYKIIGRLLGKQNEVKKLIQSKLFLMSMT